eukprot:scaffold72101_cov50-Phaeocystis_antarctica.AAC.1
MVAAARARVEGARATAVAVRAAATKAAAIDKRKAHTVVWRPAPRRSGTRRRYHCTPHRPQCRPLRLAPKGSAIRRSRRQNLRCRALFPTPPGCTSSPRSSPSYTAAASSEATAATEATEASSEVAATVVATVAAAHWVV